MYIKLIYKQIFLKKNHSKTEIILNYYLCRIFKKD